MHLLYFYSSIHLLAQPRLGMRKFRGKHSSSEVQSHPLLERHYTIRISSDP
jgi:hypothetical protein